MIYFTPPDSNDCFTRIVFGEKEYLFKFSFNYSVGCWTMGIYEDESTPIVSSIKVVPDFPLTFFYKLAVLPDGVLGVITTLERVGRDDFTNGNAKFIFVSTEELEEYGGEDDG